MSFLTSPDVASTESLYGVFEAILDGKDHPMRRLARLFQRLAPLHHAPLPVLHAVLLQELQIESFLVGIEVLVCCHIRQIPDLWVQK